MHSRSALWIEGQSQALVAACLGLKYWSIWLFPGITKKKRSLSVHASVQIIVYDWKHQVSGMCSFMCSGKKNNHESFAYSRSIKTFVHFRTRRYTRLTACVDFFTPLLSAPCQTSLRRHLTVITMFWMVKRSVSLVSVISVSSADDSVLA